MTGPGGAGPSDTPQSNDSSPAARAASIIGQHRARILDLWLDATTESVPSATPNGRSELADHLNILLDQVVDTLHHQNVEAMPHDIADLGPAQRASNMHGRERSALAGYSVDQLVHEFVILRHVITDFCRKSGIGDADCLEVINRVVELSSVSSAYAFADAMQGIREKLAGTLIHDVRTPLGVVHNYAELIRSRPVSRDRQKEIAEVIVRNVHRISSMLEELLDVAKLGAGEGLFMRFAEADLNAAVAGVCSEAMDIYSRKIVASLEPGPVIGVFDTAMVVRTLENLLSNAIKFSNDNGPITVGVQDCGDTVRVYVHNHGDPIPEQRQDSIFDFFSSGWKSRTSDAKSWGLGLALIKTVATTHGGEVIFESARDRGTTLGLALSKRFRREGEELTVLV